MLSLYQVVTFGRCAMPLRITFQVSCVVWWRELAVIRLQMSEAAQTARVRDFCQAQCRVC